MTAFRLPRPRRDTRISEPKTGIISEIFHRWLVSIINRIEVQENAQDDLLAAVAAAQAAADTATAAATSASTDAATAQTAADGANSVASLTSSGVTPNPLTATDGGASATISIAAHTRLYGDGTTLAITGPSTLTGRAYSTLYYVYYDDPTRADTTPTYASTTSIATAAQTGDRHLVGEVMTPAAAAPPTTGSEVQPPGVGNIP